MNAQPPDWASHLDQVPVLDDPQSFIGQRPRLSFFLVRRQRSAAKNAWSALDQIKHGASAPAALIPVDARPSSRGVRSALSQLPRRYIGHSVLLLFVLAVIGTGGLPALALEMDWTQGASVATDHMSGAVSADEPASVAAPVILAGSSTLTAAQVVAELNDALVPSLLPRQAVAGSAFVGTHKIAPGEKLGQIAAQYNVSVMAIVAANHIDSNMLAIGQELRIPRVSGLPHKVVEGETVESIAERYNVPSSDIRFFPPNNLSSGRALIVDEEIYIPGAVALGNGPSEAEVSGLTAVPVGVVLDDETRIRLGPSTEYEKIAKLPANAQVVLVGRHENWFKIRTPNGTEGWISADLLGVGDGVADQVAVTTDIPPLPTPQPDVAQAAPAPSKAADPAPPKPVNRWVWPTAGDITSGFGYRNMRVGAFHNGLDIANRKNTVIRAARAGRVTAAGWCSGYGYCVMIDHGDGFTTEYGHLASQPSVRVGEYVNAGDRIALMGSTYDAKGGGFSTGVHLHFTIKLSGKAVNPMRYLP